jgi:hypothetical protein
MSQASVRGSFDVSVNQTDPVESAQGPTEFDLDYYGWRVVIAACLGVMAGFGSLFVYTFSVFVKPLAAEFGWSREAVSSGFAIAAVTLGLISPLLGRWIDLRTPPNHSSVHDDLCLHIRFVSFVTCRRLAVLFDLLHFGLGWKWRGALGVLSVDFHLVRATPLQNVKSEQL